MRIFRLLSFVIIEVIEVDQKDVGISLVSLRIIISIFNRLANAWNSLILLDTPLEFQCNILMLFVDG